MKKTGKGGIILSAVLGALLFSACNQPFGQVLACRVLLSFAFTMDSNNGLSADIEGIISSNTVIISVPGGTDITSLVPSFIFIGQEVRVGTEVQTSGITARDFTQPVGYTVVSWSGEETVYTVTVFPGIPSDPWAKTLVDSPMPTADYTNFYGMAVDADGSVYAVGEQYESNMVIGVFDYDDGVTADGPDYYHNALVVKYSAEGTTLWARTISSGGGNSTFLAAAVDSDGNVYAAGWQTGTGAFDYGNSVIATSDGNGTNAVCVKYDTDGNPQWAKTVNGGSANSQFGGIAVDSAGNVYAAGYQEDVDTYDYGGSALAVGESSNVNAVLVKYDSSGNGLWASSTFSGTNGSSESRFEDVSMGDSGSIYMAGYQYLPVGAGEDFYYGSTVSCSGVQGRDNGIIVGYDTTTGAAQWAVSVEQSASENYSYFYGLTESDGALYAAGYFTTDSTTSSTFDFGNGVTIPYTALETATSYAMLVRYDASGNAQWVTYPDETSGSYSIFYGVASVLGGTIFTAGSQNGSTVYTYGAGVDVSGGGESGGNAVLVSYDSDGTAQTALSVAGSASGRSEFMASDTDSAGNAYAAGNIYNTYTYPFSTFSNDVSVAGGIQWDAPNSVTVKYGHP